MAFTHQLHSHPDAAALRKEAGAYLKRLRETAGVTQQEVAKRIGIDYYTMISQVEHGKARVPPEKMEAWAEAVGADPEEFVKRLLYFYDPFSWKALFGNQRKRNSSR